ncbi:MAG: hypothetical protein K5880_10085 [Hydrogenophaga sp.]|uniref:competence protein CoiA family protein n=1 Tax=Hydrogenophaga sp. TaxID=1904254 RepID=UPI002617E754|nr:competence protein CoiA family protein [Hydrogenophaga sp.]MCV0438971.1 hypothetical protein [Hydrogenophaga sp.]
MSSVLIMALDAQGVVRFVGDVPKGAACGCFCPTCNSPLVARKGEEKEWHFAHEAAQERPECAAGAENLARALGIEWLRAMQAKGALRLPDYKTRVSSAVLPLDGELVQWPVRLVGPLLWHEHAPKNHPVATASLDSGVPLALFVQVGESGVLALQDLPPNCAYGSLIVAPNWPAGTRTREDAMAAINQTVTFRWGFHPDMKGLVASAQRRLEEREQRIRAAQEAYQRQQSEAAGRRWAQIARMQQGHQTQQSQLELQETGLFPEPATPAARKPVSDEEAPRYSVAPGHAPNCNFQFFRLGPDEAWLYYLLDPRFVSQHPTAAERVHNPDAPSAKRWAIAPAFGQFDGWDECLPPSVGIADEENGMYWARGGVGAVIFLSQRSKGSHSAHDPAEFASK